jgi:hypothetical protein
MSIPSKRTITKRLKELRALIESTDDPIIARMAQGMETAIRWATADTVGWETPAHDAVIMAGILKNELRAKP